MKALLVNGSPHPRGCTYTALTELKNTLEAEGIEVELLHVGNKDIRGCIACRKCAQTGKCVFDDVVNEVAPKLAEADAFVIGCPVYFASPAGGVISFMDRLFFSTLGIDKTMKVGAAVVTCRRGDNTATFDVLNKYFTMTGMPVASSQYWNMVYGGSAEEVAQELGLEWVDLLREQAHQRVEHAEEQAGGAGPEQAAGGGAPVLAALRQRLPGARQGRKWHAGDGERRRGRRTGERPRHGGRRLSCLRHAGCPLPVQACGRARGQTACRPANPDRKSRACPLPPPHCPSDSSAWA